MKPITYILRTVAVFVVLETFDVVFSITVGVLDLLVVLVFHLGRVVDANGDSNQCFPKKNADSIITFKLEIRLQQP